MVRFDFGGLHSILIPQIPTSPWTRICSTSSCWATGRYSPAKSPNSSRLQCVHIIVASGAFISIARDAALQHDYNVFQYPACGVLYGKSNAGKTDLVKSSCVSCSAIRGGLSQGLQHDELPGLSERGGSFPIVVDDISPDKFRDPAISIIKNDFRMGIYPVLVLILSRRQSRPVRGDQTLCSGTCRSQHSSRGEHEEQPDTRISKYITTALIAAIWERSQTMARLR